MENEPAQTASESRYDRLAQVFSRVYAETHSVATGGDCCDFDKAANPAVPKTSYFATPDHCGDFDYDCSGLLEKQHTTGSCWGLSANTTPDCGNACGSIFGSRFSNLYVQACR